MRYFVASFLVIASLWACSIEGEDDPLVTKDEVQTSAKAGVVIVAPRQLAQYPGAPYEDSDGVFWISTVLSGIIRWNGSEFVTYSTKDGLASNAVRDILEVEDGVLWIGTTGGISSFDGESFATLDNYGEIDGNDSFTPERFHRDVWDILQRRDGTLWIATMDGVFWFDGERFVRFVLPVIGSLEKSEFTPKMVYCIFEDRNGLLWFGTDGAGVVSYDGTNMVVYTAAEHGLTSDRVCVILEDRRGDYWFGTSDGGVSRYDGQTFTTHLRIPTFSKHVGWGRVMSIVEDRSGNVWFGSSSPGGGVYRYDGESFRYFSQTEGLGNGGVPSIREDRSGNLWFGTTAGVYRLDGERFVNLTRDD